MDGLGRKTRRKRCRGDDGPNARPGRGVLGRRRPAERVRLLLEAASPRVNGSGGERADGGAGPVSLWLRGSGRSAPVGISS